MTKTTKLGMKEKKKLLKIWSEIQRNSPESKKAERYFQQRSAKIQKVFRKAYGGKISEKVSQQINAGLAALAMEGYLE